jgi:glycosyltransferase involved in cell wall biosynthesis
MTRTVLHFAQDSDTSGYFPQLALWHDRRRFRMMFGTLGPLDPRLRAHMESHGVECCDCASPSRWAYARGLARLAAFLRHHRVDILHTHLFDPSVVGLAGGLLARTPARIVTRHHSDYHTRIARPIHVWLDRLCTRMSHRVIAVSQHTADHLTGFEHAPAAKVRVVHNGIDFARVRVSSTDAPARIRADLDLSEDLLAVLPRVLARVPDLALLIAGTGPFEERYRALSASLGVDRSVRFLGFRRDLPNLMAVSDLVVLPSRAEAFGLVVAEALYLGVPVVASRVGGIPEIVEHEVDGLLVPPGDRDALAAALLRVLEDGPLRRRLAGAGRERVSRRFAFETMVREYERVYDEILAVPEPPLV